MTLLQQATHVLSIDKGWLAAPRFAVCGSMVVITHLYDVRHSNLSHDVINTLMTSQQFKPIDLLHAVTPPTKMERRGEREFAPLRWAAAPSPRWASTVCQKQLGILMQQTVIYLLYNTCHWKQAREHEGGWGWGVGLKSVSDWLRWCRMEHFVYIGR